MMVPSRRPRASPIRPMPPTGCRIYGGISWTNREITQMWYPSSGFHERQCIIVGAYVWTAEIGEVLAASPPARRLETALVSGERVHPGYRDKVADGVSV